MPDNDNQLNALCDLNRGNTLEEPDVRDPDASTNVQQRTTKAFSPHGADLGVRGLAGLPDAA